MEKVAIIIIGVAFALFCIFKVGYSRGVHEGHGEMSTWYEQTYYTECKTGKTWQLTDWDIDCNDGFSYARIEK